MADLALDLRPEAGISPLAPVFLPEFGQRVSWLMCRNPMCGSFGLHCDGATLDREGTSVGDDRCRVDLAKPQFRCRACDHSFRPPSNAGIRALARHFLSQSLPFGDCPDAACENHGWNVFEHWAPTGAARRRRYRSNGRWGVVCRACGGQFSLGTPLRLHSVARGGGADGRRRSAKRLAEQSIDIAMLVKSLRQGLHAKGIGEGAYYACLLKVAARVRDNLAWRAAALGHPRFARSKEALRVQTDVLDVSLKRHGRGPRHQLLKLIVSVAHLPQHRTWFILAAHPAFLPEGLCPDVFDLQDDLLRHPLSRRWDCLAHVLHVDYSRGLKRAKDTLPDVSRKGLLANSPYAELAHFLVVRRMLSRFPAVHHCMDGDKSLRAGALTAFNGDVRAGRVEVALFQHLKKKKGGRSSPRKGAGKSDLAQRERSLDAARRGMEARFEVRLGRQRELPAPLGEADAQVRAKEFKSAFKGAHSETGGWAWLHHPANQRQYVEARALWLTESPGKAWDVGRGLMLHATLQSVDSAFNSLRERVRAVGRPDFRAEPGRGYRGANFGVDEVMAEVVLYLLVRNYAAGAYTSAGALLPAQAMGIMPRNGRHADVLDVAWTFRLGLEHARRLSEWRMRK